MNRILFIVLLLLTVAVGANAQKTRVAQQHGTGVPAASVCTPGVEYVDDATGNLYTFKTGTGCILSGNTAAGAGTVTTVSVVSANGQSGSVANATTTPAITLNNPTALNATTSIQSPFFKSAAADPADAGAIRLGNNEFIEWEKATPGTDWTFGVNASDVLITNAPFSALTLTGQGLTSGRVPFAGTGGLLGDDADLTFATDTLTFTKGVASTNLSTPIIKPPSDSTTAIQITKTDGTTRVVDVDTTNARVGINKTPGAFDLDVNGAANIGGNLISGSSQVKSAAGVDSEADFFINNVLYAIHGVSAANDDIIAGSVLGDSVLRNNGHNILFSGDSGSSIGLKVSSANIVIVPKQQTIGVGATSSALTDLLINPTTKASGNLIAAQVNSIAKYAVDFSGFAYMAAGWQVPVSGNITSTVGGNASGELDFSSAGVVGWTAGASALAARDVTISRNNIGILQVGTTAANASGSLIATALKGTTPTGIFNFNQAAQSQVVTSGTEYYITRSDLDMPASYLTAIAAGTTMSWHVVINKTAAGTGTFQVLLKKGTNGSTADTSIVTQSLGTQTAAVDNLTLDITLTWTSATAAYWSIVARQIAASGTGFGLVYPSVTTVDFNGTISGQTTTTASDKYGLSVISTTGTPTLLVTQVQAQAYGVN